jgi:hypothetical protein
VHAAKATMQFSGAMLQPIPLPGVDAGTPVVGTVTYDTSNFVTRFTDLFSAGYLPTAGGNVVTIQLGTNTLVGEVYNLVVRNLPPHLGSDEIAIEATIAECPIPYDPSNERPECYLGFYIRVYDQLTSSAIPTTFSGPTQHIFGQISRDLIEPGRTDYGYFSGQSMTITPVNSPPVAAIAPIGSAQVGHPVTLDGSGSSDPDSALGDSIVSYEWRIYTPRSHELLHTIVGSSPIATFTPDYRSLSYQVVLKVTDSYGGFDEAETLFSLVNTSPVADAGPDISLAASGTVWLPCYLPTPCGENEVENRSYDEDEYDTLQYEWYIRNPTECEKFRSPYCMILIDRGPTVQVNVTTEGEHHFRLAVFDNWGAMSTDDVVVTLRSNTQPVAVAGVNQSVPVETEVFLDGSGSSDPDGDELSFQWSLTSVPSGSLASLIGTGSQRSFIPDLPGIYVATLIVSDGRLLSRPSSVTITAMTIQEAATVELQTTMDTINIVPLEVFTNSTMQNTSTNKISSVLQDIEQGNYQDAKNKLTHDLLAKYDGCYLRGAADKNDWVKDCAEQLKIYQQILDAIALLPPE